MYAIIYIGPPYGQNESGHIVSCHKSRETAERRFTKESRTSDNETTTYPLNHQIVKLDENKSWRRY